MTVMGGHWTWYLFRYVKILLYVDSRQLHDVMDAIREPSVLLYDKSNGNQHL